jgi:hypothetical protein
VPLLLILLPLLWLSVEAQPTPPAYCTLTQNAWLAPTPLARVNDTMCGSPWVGLLAANASALLVPANAAWLLGFHQYVAAQMNRRQLLAQGRSPAPLDTAGVTEATALMGDTLERACPNVSRWQFTPTLNQAYALLWSFNHGLLAGLPACPTEFAPPSASNATFYYYRRADEMVVWDAASNTTQGESIEQGIYATQGGLFFGLVLSIVINIVLGIKLIKRNGEAARAGAGQLVATGLAVRPRPIDLHDE